MAEIETEKRRFAIIRHLHDTPGRELGHAVLKAGCRAQGIPTTDDQAKTAMNWLAENDLVTLASAGTIVMARLTSVGDDVVRGYSTVPGVLVFGDPV